MANANVTVPGFYGNASANLATQWSPAFADLTPMVDGHRSTYMFDYSQAQTYFFVFGSVTIKPAIPRPTIFPSAT